MESNEGQRITKFKMMNIVDSVIVLPQGREGESVRERCSEPTRGLEILLPSPPRAHPRGDAVQPAFKPGEPITVRDPSLLRQR